MPLLFTRFRNSDYLASDDGDEHATPEAALAIGVRSAATIATEEISRCHRSSAVEVSVEDPDGTQLLCSVVTVSVSPMKLMAVARDLDDAP